MEQHSSDEIISAPKVMKSNAGYYIGTEYQDMDCGGMWFPYARLSGYFSSKEVAEKFLPDYS